MYVYHIEICLTYTAYTLNTYAPYRSVFPLVV